MNKYWVRLSNGSMGHKSPAFGELCIVADSAEKAAMQYYEEYMSSGVLPITLSVISEDNNLQVDVVIQRKIVAEVSKGWEKDKIDSAWKPMSWWDL